MGKRSRKPEMSGTEGIKTGAESIPTTDNDNGVAAAVSEALVVSSSQPIVSLRGPDWPYYGATDAAQHNTIDWNPGLVSQPRKKVAIIGFTPSRTGAPFTDPEYEIWGENALFTHKDVLRCSRWFDMHDPKIIPEDRLSFYRDIDIPIFLQDVREDVPGSVKFPKEEIEAFLSEMSKGGSGYDGSYFTNSISWMIGLAIWEGFEVIDVYGVDMGQAGEYASQRPNVEFFLGVCLGLGIEFTIPPTSDLLKATHQYGYGSDGGFRAKLLERRDEFLSRKKFFLDEIEKRQIEIRQLRVEAGIVDGALQATLWSLRSWSVADHTSMVSDGAKLAEQGNGIEPESVALLQAGETGGAVEVMSMEELQAADAEPQSESG